MSKRAAESKASPKAKAMKSEQRELDPKLELLLQLVERAPLSETAKSMLTSMSPHCWGSPAHEFQLKMKEMLHSVVDMAEAEHLRCVEEAQAKLKGVQTESEEAGQRLTSAGEEVSAAKAHCAQQEEAWEVSKQEVRSSNEAVGKAQANAESLETERSAMVAEKAEYECLLTGDWAVLKAGSLDAKKWRQRAKLINFTLKMLESRGLDAALAGALPVALKTKPSERGSFSTKAIDYAEEMLKKAIASLEEKLGSFETEAAARGRELAAAGAALEASRNAAAAQGEAAQQAAGRLGDAEAALAAARKAEKALAPKVGKAQASLAEAQSQLEEVQKLVVEFKAQATTAEAFKEFPRQGTSP